MQRSMMLALVCLVAGVTPVAGLQESFTLTVFPPQFWTVMSNDSGICAWNRGIIKYRTAPGCATVRCEDRPRVSDDWLITPRLYPTPGDDQFSFVVRSHNRPKVETLEVWASTTDCELADFTYSLGGMRIGSSAYLPFSVSLAQFDSVPVYVAIRYRSTGKRALYVDDVLGPSYIMDDAGVVAIIEPGPYEQPDSAVNPRVVVTNFGAAAQTGFTVRVVVINQADQDTVYEGTAFSGALNPQDSVELVYDTPWQTTAGQFDVYAFTELTGDLEPRNDTQHLVVSVIPGDVNDVAVSAIVQPSGTIGSGAVVPVVEVANLGNVPASFPVSFTVLDNGSPVHTDTVDVVVPAETVQLVEFAVWAADPGIYSLFAQTALAGDIDPSNDTLSGAVEVIQLMHDVGATEIVAPVDTVTEGDVVAPVAVFANFGDFPETFGAVYRIADGYLDSAQVSLAPAEADTVTFADWTAATVGEWAVLAFTTLADGDPTNDTVAASVYVEPLQAQSETPSASALAPLRVRTVPGSMTISFGTRPGTDYSARIFDAAGRCAARLQGRSFSAEAALNWSGPSGIYIVRVESAGTSRQTKAVMLR